MTEVICLTNPPYGSCTYVVLAKEEKQALIVDPGSRDLRGLEACLRQHAIQNIGFVVLTHEHFDHIAGVDLIRKQYKTKLLCTAACAQRVADPRLNLSQYQGSPLEIRQVEWICEEKGWIVPWGRCTLTLIPTPGHSPGGLCAAIGGVLFTGDTLLGNSRTPTHLPGGDVAMLKTSLKVLFGRFAAETVVYPGHGESFVLGAVDPQSVLRT